MFEFGFSLKKVWDTVSDPRKNDRDSLVSLRDVRAILAKVEKKAYSLHEDDDRSTSMWIQRLREKGDIIDFASDGSNFRLGIMTEFGRAISNQFNQLVCLDSTHKTTQYGFSLFTLVAQNDHGEGVPLSYLITSNEKAAAIKPWLTEVKAISGEFGCIMTDNDDAEIDAVESVFPRSRHLLCWWHVLKNWNTNRRSKLPSDLAASIWTKLLHLLMSSEDFDRDFEEIIRMSTPEFTTYLRREWYPKRQKWAFTFRKDIPMFRKTNTNMLIESFHNLLKTQFMQGKRNRRVDRLLYLLTGPVEDHYYLKHRRHEVESAKDDLVEREKENLLALNIPSSHIQSLSPNMFRVSCMIEQQKFYQVDILTGNCECTLFQERSFCAHYFACMNKFGFEVEEEDVILDDTDDEHIENIQKTSEPDSKLVTCFMTTLQSISRHCGAMMLIDKHKISKELTNTILNIGKQITAAANSSVLLLPTPEEMPPNQLNTSVTVHPFKSKKSRGRPKNIKNPKGNSNLRIE